ncbi:MAG: Uma2 family endonuclease [Desulfobacter postgatei]|uniref:Uma2 family endonuclease n=1 Tax=Desulfobacter postgatei TaxID=2293 RepID=UPI0023F01700|nr:Uma2 family endonuclease [Desulfobacter postgatei]MDD4273273.1 Uma2 family endonuclease [Desulfobacter postgatei]
MTAQPKENNKMTPAEYLAMERNALDIKHEFFDGEIFAMVGARINHIRINANLTRELGNRFKNNKSSCEVLPNDMRVKIEAGYVYPDITILCEDPEFEGNEFDTLINPVVIIEILSKSTEAFDRGKKFNFYQAIPTLQEYVLVSQDEYRVEQFTRSDEDKWEYRSYKNTEQVLKLKLKSVDCELPLSEIYWDVKFESNSTSHKN